MNVICRYSPFILLLILALLLIVPPLRAQEAVLLRAQVEAAEGFAQPVLLARFYQQRSYALAWIAAGRPTPPAFALARALRQVEADGLDPHEFQQARIDTLFAKARRAGRLEAAEQGRLDLLLTDAFLQYGTFLLRGRTDPRTVHAGWNLPPRSADLVALLDAACHSGELEAVLARLAPPYPPYHRLRQARARYQRLAEQGGWAPLAAGPTLRRGDAGPAVQALHTRLHRTGDLATLDPDSLDDFSAALEQAVLTFQERHGLEEDGLVGRATRAALNVPVAARLRQIDRNLERWRWLPETLGRRHIHVNIAGFSLAVVEDGAPVLAMRVIVGTRRNRTPVFSTQLTEVVLAPYWNVPASIYREEILPAVQQDPKYLARNHMKRLASGRIRQDPGPTNPLGRVKFTIANPFGIGLHDTPSRHLFQQRVCTFSHGCLRAEKPLALARYVLASDTTWTPEKIEQTIARWIETRIAVPEPLPIHVLYWTAWVDDAGTLQFRDDIYGYDARLDRALAL